MKKLALILMIISAIKINSYGQEDPSFTYMSKEDSLFYRIREDSTRVLITNYGMEINQFTTQSGFNPGMEAALFIRDYNKSLELGAYFDGKSLKLTGLSLTHKHYLLKKYFDNKKIFEPYVFYNFIYRSTILDTILTTKTILAKTICPDKATYTSLEHYAGIGIEVNVKNIMYFNGNIGVGGYIGSIKKPCLDQNSIIYRGSSGLGVIVRFGFGFRIP